MDKFLITGVCRLFAALFSLSLLSFSLLSLATIYATETRRSDKPLTAQQAAKQSGIRLPVPDSARNVRFSLTGETQNWDLYLCFQASIEQIQKAIDYELGSYKKRATIAGVFPSEHYRRKPIPESVDAQIERSSPNWWQPRKIKNGYFIGSSNPHGYGPRFWVDIETQTVFYFEHF